MVKLSDMRTADQIAAGELADPDIRREHDRTAFAHAVAMRVLAYRTERGLSQTQLARKLGMHQAAVARLEDGDHEPSLATLAKLAKGLGVEFHVDITPDTLELRDIA
jgi:ribosome-binding protein aMBF1 (putative translation factor)